MKASPDKITSLKPDEVFVFGSNEAGIHGAGAAKLALKWGAKMGRDGLCGQTYGISTKDRNIKTLPLSRITDYVHEFLWEAETRPHLTFLVTEIGCGLAGYEPKDIAPLFRGAAANILLPRRFIEVLQCPKPSNTCTKVHRQDA